MTRNASYRRERYQRPRRRGLGCLGWLVALVWILLLVVLGYRFWLRPQVSAYVSDRIASEVGLPARSPAAPGGATSEVEQQAGQALPTVVAALPSGQIRITEQQANEYLAGRKFAPVDSVQVRFIPGTVEIELTAFGISSTARAGLAVQNGRVITLDPKIDGPLGQLISITDLAGNLEQQINDQLSSQDRRLRDVQVNQGEIIADVE